MIVRVLPDVAAIDKEFDYLVPEPVRDQVQVGTMVRVSLHGRRVGGWVTEVGTEAPAGVALKPIAKVTGVGPAAEMFDLARWAAWRWAGRPARFLRTASPPAAVRSLPATPSPPGVAERRGSTPSYASTALEPVQAVLRLPPLADRWPVIEASVAAAEAAGGHALVLCPGHDEARRLGRRLRGRSGAGPVAVLAHDRPDTGAAGEWARARAGATVVGARAAAWAPVTDLRRVVVLDEHDEAYQQEQAPTWNARDVVAERAARAGGPCLLVSPCPTLDALRWGQLVRLPSTEERRGWPRLETIDRRDEGPSGRGLLSPRLTDVVRSDGRVVCVLNRRGRAKLLACGTCDELARCAVCDASMEQMDPEQLRCRRCGAERPLVCMNCGGGRFRNLRMGVARATEELAALVGEPVDEVTASTTAAPIRRVVIGTEAALHRVERADTVVFLDIDQELSARRYRAPEEALAMLARAARLLRPPARGRPGRLVVQTRQPDHAVLAAVRRGDPGPIAEQEAALRSSMRMPPAWAVAVISGPSASAYVHELQAPQVTAERGGRRSQLLGPNDGRWILRAPDHATLSDLLTAAPRPSGRLRIEVDPMRL